MNAGCKPGISKAPVLATAVVACLTFVVADFRAFADEAPAPKETTTLRQGFAPSAAAPAADLRELYFGPPIMPPKHILRAEEPAEKVAAPRQASVKKPVAKQTHARPHAGKAGKKVIATPGPHVKSKRAAVAVYKEAVPTAADAFSGERSIRWRKCIPGVQMPLVCYLPKEDRLSITVHPTD
jgi:hypothetical protein